MAAFLSQKITLPRTAQRQLTLSGNRQRRCSVVRASAPESKSDKVVKSTPSSPDLKSGEAGIHNVENAYWDAASEANTWYPCPPPDSEGSDVTDSVNSSQSPHLHSDQDKQPTYGSKIINHSEKPNTAESTSAYWKAATKNDYSEGTSGATTDSQDDNSEN
mmetsp:Transcript_18674/g.22372  ORF Transcript_18674/g.22372 Transcript_18674/m.22372 type:complete len:161 (-) Transcript_18674:55-537(-)|eukprot:CAMPEP_0197847404 /NCGR_PEP_ID=MMETSP1438-20131217/6026_1 /TAXON_ID=1461541 /ORGANISM="Pterosperma sp., Strain CCMP1384" /LENGTH=160 /DNA_ID=CAMNT_0043459317 /DNA_START=181 /DNA_END=663 /DNA_ORIENTATION=+